MSSSPRHRRSSGKPQLLWNRIPFTYRLLIIVLVAVIYGCSRFCSTSSAPQASTDSRPATEMGAPAGSADNHVGDGSRMGQGGADHLSYGPGSIELLKVRPAQGSEPLPEELLQYAGMDVSFNPDLHIPNWVAWELLGEETTGGNARSNRFVPDPGVAASATTDDYRNSGFDRGHMAPAGDMKWSREAMDETFYLTNICPQNKSLNTGAWKKLEEKCRQWARRDSAIIVVCGPILTDSIDQRIGATGVAVPKRFFKVVLAPYAVPARGIGFIMANSSGNPGMQQTAVSIDDVERATGLDFFFNLPDDIESAVESVSDFNLFSDPR